MREESEIWFRKTGGNPIPSRDFKADITQVNIEASQVTINFGMNDVYSVQPTMNMVVGKHFLKFGAEGRKYNDNTLNPGTASGTYGFTRGWPQASAATPNATTGNAVASFLLGSPAPA